MIKENSVTQTKILIPRKRNDLISRQRLLDLLYEILDLKLIILSAPAGYGKTTLLIDLIYKSQWKFCWYAIDKLDQDPLRFMAHFIASIMHQFPEFGKESFSALSNMTQDQLNLDFMITVIINDIFKNIKEHFVLIMDDYHLVDNTDEVSYFVSNFIQNMGDNCHVILSSRTLLSLPDLPLLVARSQVGGLSYEELTFSSSEIQEFMFHNFQQDISEAEALELAIHTKGWITGLLLSSKTSREGISNSLRVARASGIGLYEFLAQQVLEKQPEHIQKFLLWSSLLDEFNSENCEEIIGEALGIKKKWDSLLNFILQENLFILPVGEDSLWLRYHHLFQEFLHAQIRSRYPVEYEKIKLRQADLEIAAKEWEKAYAIYEELENIDHIIYLLELAGSSLLSDGKLITLSNWLEALPTSRILSNPTIVSLQGSVAVMRGNTKEGLEMLNRAILELSPEKNPGLYTNSMLRRSVTLRLAGDYNAAINDAEKVIELSQAEPDLRTTWAEALRAKGTALFQLGQLQETLDCFTKALDVYQNIDDTHNAAILLMEIGLLYKASGDFVSAEKSYQKAYVYWKKTENSTWLANLLNNLGELQHMTGEYIQASKTLDEAIQHAKRSGYNRIEAYSLASLGDLYRDIEAYSEAMDVYHQSERIARKTRDYFLLFYIDLSKCNLANLKGDYFQAKKMLHAAEQKAFQSKSDYDKYLYLLEKSIFDFSNRRIKESILTLEDAIQYFQDAGLKVEWLKAVLFLSCAYFLNNQKEKAKSLFSQIIQSLSDPGYFSPILNSIRIIKPSFIKLAKDDFFSHYINDFSSIIDNFEKSLISIREKLSKNTTVVVFSSPKLFIRTFGKIEIQLNNHIISGTEWQSQTARDLMLLILANPEGLTKESIGEYFWPESSPAELKMRFKNTIYRLRHAIGKDTIMFIDGYYRFNYSLEYEYDVEIFRKEIYLAEKSDVNKQKINHYKTAINLYSGEYLPELDDIWVITQRHALYEMYINTLLNISNLYYEMQDYDNALMFAQNILVEDPCHENGHRSIMKIHAARGNKAAVVRQFEQCKRVLEDELNTSPSRKTLSLYDHLIK